MYNIIWRSSTNIWWTTLVVLSKWLHCDLWPFHQVSNPGPFGLSCLQAVSLWHIVKNFLKETNNHPVSYVSGITQNPGNHQFHVCEECGLSFLIKRLLNAHLKARHSEKYSFNVACYICNKKFKVCLLVGSVMSIHVMWKVIWSKKRSKSKTLNIKVDFKIVLFFG